MSILFVCEGCGGAVDADAVPEGWEYDVDGPYCSACGRQDHSVGPGVSPDPWGGAPPPEDPAPPGSGSAGSARRLPPPRWTGQPRPISEGFTLYDQAPPDDWAAAGLASRLARLRVLDEVVHWAATEADALRLDATWIILEGADDNIDAAIADVRRQLQGRS